MIAIEIRINGDLKLTCGCEDLEKLSAHVSASGKLGNESPLTIYPEYVLESYGLHSVEGIKEVLKWNRTIMSINDEISFKFIETNNADDPVDKQILSLDSKS